MKTELYNSYKMTRPLLTFTVDLMHTGAKITARAHFCTIDQSTCTRMLKLWIKPHWYSRSRCVGTWDWNLVRGVSADDPSGSDWLKEAHVKL